MTSESKEKDSNRHGKNKLEWVVFALSSLLVIGALSFLVFSAITGENKPADVQVKVGNLTVRGASTIVTLAISNVGSKTASEVNISVIAKYGDKETESTVVVDFVPKGSNREAIVVFAGDQKPNEIIPRIIGYVEP